MFGYLDTWSLVGDTIQKGLDVALLEKVCHGGGGGGQLRFRKSFPFSVFVSFYLLLVDQDRSSQLFLQCPEREIPHKNINIGFV